ncbi:NTF2-like N-terminal transpeptidase domain-containing protein [Nonomuraea sp. NPDC004702]
MSVFSCRWRRTASTIAVLGVGIAVYLAVRTEGSPQRTATAFLTAWQRGDLSAMKAQVLEPPRDFDGVYNAFTKGSQAKRMTIQDVRVRPKAYLNFGETATYHASFAVTLDGPVPYTYDGQLEIIEFDRAWKVSWSPTAIHPQLQKVGFSEVRQIRVVPQPDGSSRLVLLETRAEGERAGALFADEGLKPVAVLADSAQPGVAG